MLPRWATWPVAVVLTGVMGGIVGSALTLLLHAVQHISFGYTENTFLYGVEHASGRRRVVVLVLAGVVAAAGWTLLHRRGRVGSVAAAVALPTAVPGVAGPSLAGPRVTDLTTAGSAVAAPSVTDPSVTDPAVAGPDVAGFATADSAVADPAVAAPPAAAPSAADPPAADPPAAPPVAPPVAAPSANQLADSAAAPAAADPSAADPGVGAPGTLAAARVSRASLPVADTTTDGVLQVLVVGMGASLGREGAPRQVAAALSGWLAGRLTLSDQRRRVLIALGAGSGLAAVYNVPFAGGLFAAQVLLGTLALDVVLPALAASWVAVAVSWTVLPDQPAYRVVGLHGSWSLLVWSLLIAPVAAVTGRLFAALCQAARTRRARPPWLAVVPVLVFAALGAAAVRYPQLLGNGKGPAQLGFDGRLGLGLAATLIVLKPVATAGCLRAGAVGGLLTPALATGAALGALTGGAWLLLWPGSPAGAYSVVAATAVLAVTQRALLAVVLVIELTAPTGSLVVPMIVAAAAATLAARHMAWLRVSALGETAS